MYCCHGWALGVCAQPDACPCLPVSSLPNPQNCKYAVQRDVLPDGTVVPAGAQVIYSPYVVNRLEGVWGPDALAFRPERWLEMDKAPTPYAYLTFNAGRLELSGWFMSVVWISRFCYEQWGLTGVEECICRGGCLWQDEIGCAGVQPAHIGK